MEYRRFERLVIGAAALLVGLTLAASFAMGGLDAAEVVAQVAVVAVVAVAVHWGRKAGTVAALAACLLYLALRLPMLATGVTTGMFLLVITRFAGYCIIGIVGGEVFARVKYLFAEANATGVIDSWSRVYNQRYASRALDQAIERHRRYQEPFAVIILSLAPSLSASQRPEKLRGLVRSVAGILRDDVRMVDDVARIDDGRFVILLPHTPGTATPLVAERLVNGVCQALGLKKDAMTTVCLGAAENTAALQEFAAGIAPSRDEPEAQPPSGT